MHVMVARSNSSRFGARLGFTSISACRSILMLSGKRRRSDFTKFTRNVMQVFRITEAFAAVMMRSFSSSEMWVSNYPRYGLSMSSDRSRAICWWSRSLSLRSDSIVHWTTCSCHDTLDGLEVRLDEIQITLKLAICVDLIQLVRHEALIVGSRQLEVRFQFEILLQNAEQARTIFSGSNPSLMALRCCWRAELRENQL